MDKQADSVNEGDSVVEDNSDRRGADHPGLVRPCARSQVQVPPVIKNSKQWRRKK
jgi:hypothetical protein